jgi:hypothetical protein
LWNVLQLPLLATTPALPPAAVAFVRAVVRVLWADCSTSQTTTYGAD